MPNPEKAELMAEKISEMRLRALACASACKVAAGRTQDRALKDRYDRYERACRARSERLVQALERMGKPATFTGLDARLAQVEAENKLQAALVADHQPSEDVEMEDLEHMALASTHDRIQWQALQIAAQDDRALADALGDVDQIVRDEVEMNDWAMREWLRRMDEELELHLSEQQLSMMACPRHARAGAGHHGEGERHHGEHAKMGKHQSIEEMTGGAIRKG